MINRREAIRILSAGTLAACAVAKAADAPLHFTALDHLEISEPDSAKSAALYARIFGGPIWKNNKTQRRYVKLGPCYIAIEQGREPFGVDHFSAGIEGYRIADIHAYLEQRGIAYRDYPSGKDLNVTDPDGIHVQLSADNTWEPLAVNTASPEPNTFSATADLPSHGPRSHFAERFGPGEIGRVLRKDLRTSHAAQQQPYLVPSREIPDRAVASARRTAAGRESFLRCRRIFRLRRRHENAPGDRRTCGETGSCRSPRVPRSGDRALPK